jgi:hypothetical protein
MAKWSAVSQNCCLRTAPSQSQHATLCYPKFHQVTKYATLCNIMQLAKGGKNYCLCWKSHTCIRRLAPTVKTCSLQSLILVYRRFHWELEGTLYLHLGSGSYIDLSCQFKNLRDTSLSDSWQQRNYSTWLASTGPMYFVSLDLWLAYLPL